MLRSDIKENFEQTNNFQDPYITSDPQFNSISTPLINIRPKPTKHSNATLAIISTFAISIISYTVFHFLFPNSITENTEMVLLEDLLNISQNVSAADYLFRLHDIKFKEITLLDRIRSKFNETPLTPREPDKTQDRRGIIVGFLAAAAICTFKLIKETVFSGPIFNLMLKILNVIVSTVSGYLGLGNRVGQTVKTLFLYNQDGTAKRVNYSFSIAVAIAMGAIFAGLSIAFHFSTGGISSLIFQSVDLISSFASASGYIGRIFDTLFSDRTIRQVIKDKIKGESKEISWNWEKKMTAAGVILGLGLATALIIVATHGVGLVLLAGIGLHAAATTSTVCTSVLFLSTYSMLVSRLGGLFNRLGQFMDKCSSAQNTNVLIKPDKENLTEQASYNTQADIQSSPISTKKNGCLDAQIKENQSELNLSDEAKLIEPIKSSEFSTLKDVQSEKLTGIPFSPSSSSRPALVFNNTSSQSSSVLDSSPSLDKI